MLETFPFLQIFVTYIIHILFVLDIHFYNILPRSGFERDIRQGIRESYSLDPLLVRTSSSSCSEKAVKHAKLKKK